MPTSLRVYVSSTFIDLERFRAKVNARLRRAGHELVAMEDYPAFDARPLDKCIADVARCNVYVGIVAKRYGFIPKVDNPDGRSITELEYCKATECGLPRLIFQLDPKTPWLEEYDDRLAVDGDGGQAIRRFRADLCEAHGNRYFTNEEELAGLVLEALAHIPLPETDEPPSSGHTAPIFHWPMALDFGAYVARKRDGFVGRRWLFEDIDTWFADATPGKSSVLLIRADFGVGKSALLAELAHRNPHGAVLAVHFCLHDTADSLKPGPFVASLAAQLAKHLPAYRAAVEADSGMQERLARALEDPASALEFAVLAPLTRLAAPQLPGLLLIDALDEALELVAQDPETARRHGTLIRLLAAKAGALPPWLRIIATSRNHPEVLNRLQQGFAVKALDAESRANQDDLCEYVTDRCHNGAVVMRLAAVGKAPAQVIATLLAKSQGKFLYAARVLDDLANDRLSVDALDALPPGMDGFYREAFERRFARAGRDFAPAGALLGIIAAAREPLAAETLAAVAGAHLAEVRSLRTVLPDFLPLRRGGIAFDHLSLAEWLTCTDAQGFPRAGPFAVDFVAAETALHDWAMQAVKQPADQIPTYLLRHLAAHLPDADERRRVFARLMLHFDWLATKLAHQGIDSLIADCEHLGSTVEASNLRALLRNAAHVLRRSPEQLAAQIIGRGLHTIGEPGDLAGLVNLARSAPVGAPLLMPRTASLRLDRRLLAVLEGHGGSVMALVPLPDGGLASAGNDGTVRLWDLTGGGSPTVLEGHTDSVHALAVLHDGRLASAGHDRTVRLWDLADNRLSVLEGHTDVVRALAVLYDGRLASASDDRTVLLWDLAIGGAPAVLEGHTDVVRALAVLPDGRLASAGDDRTVRLWDLAVGGGTVLEGHTNVVRALAVLPDGRLASAGDDRTVRLWDLAVGGAPTVLEGHTSGVNALAVLSDGRLASAGDDGKVRQWDIFSGQPTVLEGHVGSIHTLRLLPNERLAFAGYDRTVRLWDIAIGGMPTVMNGHRNWVFALALLPDGRLASAGHDHTVRLWDIAGGGLLTVLEGHSDKIQALAVLPDGRLASAGDDGGLYLWNIFSGQPTVLGVHTGMVSALVVLPDGRLAFAGRGKVRLWDLASGNPPTVLEGHAGGVKALAVLTDGRLASAGEDRTVRLWDLAGGGPPSVLEGHTDWVRALAVLPDGRLASAGDDRTVRLWDLAGGGPPSVLEGHTDWVRALAVLPDGRVASAGDDRTVRLWDSSTRLEITRFDADHKISCLAVISPNRLVAGDDAGTLHWLELSEPAPIT